MLMLVLLELIMLVLKMDVEIAVDGEEVRGCRTRRRRPSESVGFVRCGGGGGGSSGKVQLSGGCKAEKREGMMRVKPLVYVSESWLHN